MENNATNSYEVRGKTKKQTIKPLKSKLELLVCSYQYPICLKCHSKSFFLILFESQNRHRFANIGIKNSKCNRRRMMIARQSAHDKSEHSSDKQPPISLQTQQSVQKSSSDAFTLAVIGENAHISGSKAPTPAQSPPQGPFEKTMHIDDSNQPQLIQAQQNMESSDSATSLLEKVVCDSNISPPQLAQMQQNEDISDSLATSTAEIDDVSNASMSPFIQTQQNMEGNSDVAAREGDADLESLSGVNNVDDNDHQDVQETRKCSHDATNEDRKSGITGLSSVSRIAKKKIRFSNIKLKVCSLLYWI